MPSSHLILCRPLLLLTPIPPSIRVFSNESTLRMRWPKYFGFSIIPSREIPGLISFRMDWLDLLAVQGTLKSLLQHILTLTAASCLWAAQRSCFLLALTVIYLCTVGTTTVSGPCYLWIIKMLCCFGDLGVRILKGNFSSCRTCTWNGWVRSQVCIALPRLWLCGSPSVGMNI